MTDWLSKKNAYKKQAYPNKWPKEKPSWSKKKKKKRKKIWKNEVLSTTIDP